MNQIKDDFNQAAKSYEENALLQKEVAHRLFERISVIRVLPLKILDIGSGTGFLTRKIADLFPNSKIFALDIAKNMHEVARQKNKNHPNINYYCQDMHQLNFENQSFDLIISNLSFQWSENLARLFSEINRVLNDDGLVFFSMIGENSLYELKNTYQKIWPNRKFKNFVGIDELTSSIKKSGLNQIVIECEKIILDYKDVNLLIRDFKKIGANNKIKPTEKGLIGKNKWNQFIKNYPESNGFYPASYNIFYTHTFKTKINHNHQRLIQRVQLDSF